MARWIAYLEDNSDARWVHENAPEHIASLDQHRDISGSACGVATVCIGGARRSPTAASHCR